MDIHYLTGKGKRRLTTVEEQKALRRQYLTWSTKNSKQHYRTQVQKLANAEVCDAQERERNRRLDRSWRRSRSANPAVIPESP